jgi:hypothetical protein
MYQDIYKNSMSSLAKSKAHKMCRNSASVTRVFTKLIVLQITITPLLCIATIQSAMR